MLLQLALTLGESRDSRVAPTLAQLARNHGDVNWMATALLSSLSKRELAVLDELLKDNLTEAGETRITSVTFCEQLCAATAARGDAGDIAAALERLTEVADVNTVASCLRGLRSSFESPRAGRILQAGRSISGRWECFIPDRSRSTPRSP